MTLEALSSNEFLNFIIYDTISATPYSSQEYSLETAAGFSLGNNCTTPQFLEDQVLNIGALNTSSFSAMTRQRRSVGVESMDKKQNLAVRGGKKRRRKPRVCKNKEEAETQRMTHIAVERNRRKQMNEHLAVLRSLMPESYVQRGDQASIVGGAIDFLKELEHLLLSLVTQKLQLLQNRETAGAANRDNSFSVSEMVSPPLAQLFMYPHYTWSQIPKKFTSRTKAAIADVEVTLIETHANLRILSRRNPRHLSKLVAGLHSLHLSILHLNVITMDPLVLYSISAKVEEGCPLTSVDDIAGAVHHMLRIIEEAQNVDGSSSVLCCL
ncbi:transcription factor bHLH71-like [Mangifera indica]|uniref:transcription factor bHLH71-like n=1 Tax=Mangifera indica TaxID=29780 RepID=UPI001CFC0D3B|nr:transcription factor bHLH71-like [Mangifera indica]